MQNVIFKKKFTNGYLYLCSMDKSNLNFAEFKNVDRERWSFISAIKIGEGARPLARSSRRSVGVAKR